MQSLKVSQEDERTKILGRFGPTSPASSLTLPAPTLSLDFRLECDIFPKIPVGMGPWGQRNWISFKGGRWSATWGNGNILPGGQDAQTVLDDLSTFVDTRYLLETSDKNPAYIMVQTSGWRIGPKEVLEKLFDPQLADSVKPEDYSFKLYIKMETGDERYSFVNTSMWIGSGARGGNKVVYDAYKIL